MNDTFLTSKRFARAAASVPAARVFAREILIKGGADRDLDDALLCVSELATNAVRYGVPVGGAFLLKVGVGAGGVRIECHDAGRRRPRLRHPADDDQTGRGLLLVEAVASRWGVGERPFGKFVWVELDIKAGRCTSAT
ncbi:ATP-binding protein [Streptomyces sp. ISL-99]|uniref:ATP-binding protein n=1 Tax=Streptomyces sp. ISL-99 TaxID=2819193 RepID=UPI001BEAE958|nr:ATP-binding protein [Streptomyces sp. ISL-99]MBT2525028.1 ATP-binding protein [Streptomyces sp. ISL-99]